MKKLLFALAMILTVFCFEVSAQTTTDYDLENFANGGLFTHTAVLDSGEYVYSTWFNIGPWATSDSVRCFASSKISGVAAGNSLAVLEGSYNKTDITVIDSLIVYSGRTSVSEQKQNVDFGTTKYPFYRIKSSCVDDSTNTVTNKLYFQRVEK
jgi:hypothetical protein